MPKLAKIGRANARMLAQSLQETLKEFGEEFGLTIVVPRNWRFTDRNVSFKVEVSIGDQSELDDQQEREFKAYAVQFGLSPDDFGKTVSLWAGRGQKRFKIVGIKPQSFKYPILCEQLAGRGSGKVYKFPASDIAIADKS